MRNIAVVTGTRAEYGLLKNIIKAIDQDRELNLQLVVTGMHLSIKYGMTINEIKQDGFKISAVCPILLDDIGRDRNAREISIAINEFAKAFLNLEPDFLLILGDRYEVFAAATTAMSMNIPIAHIAGGEITEGAMDEQIRHSITKMSHLHFPGADVYAENIKNMGEEEWRIFNVGDSGIENIKLTQLMTRQELNSSLGVEVDEETLLVTYHPVTLERDKVDEQINHVIQALERVNKKMIITYPNSDMGGDRIILALNQLYRRNNKVYLFESLGSLRYLSVMKYCGIVVGNSSSAIIEAPYFKKPVVNIGSRQKGRLMASNIIQADNSIDSIVKGIEKAMSLEFKREVVHTKSLYGEGNTSNQIVKMLKEVDIDERLLKKRLFG